MPDTPAYEKAFRDHILNRLKQTEILLDIFFSSELMFMFVTTRNDSEGYEVDQISLIAKDYVRESFIFDAIGCLPGLLTVEMYPYIYPLKLLRFI